MVTEQVKLIQSLSEAANKYLTSLKPVEKMTCQQEISTFIRWHGENKPFSSLTPPNIGKYAEAMSPTDPDTERKLKVLRGFLSYAKEQGWTEKNMSVHLKARKGKIKSGSVIVQELTVHTLTREGHTRLTAELEELKIKRIQVIEEMRRAAADKDFRENAPLEAAREQRGRIEGQIRELEVILKTAQIVEENHIPSLKANIGDCVMICDAESGENCSYTIVSPRETDPSKGKISSQSPLGKAILGKTREEFIEINVPAGKLRYQIKKVERK